jgi:plastocyanin
LLALLTAFGQFAACGGVVEPPPGVQSPTVPSDDPVYRYPLSATIRLTPEGPEPALVTINVGGRVTFVNDDERPHEIVSDPYLRHEECPPTNRVGFLTPGKQAVTGVFEKVVSCGFHDHLDPTGVFGRIDVRIE